MQLFGTVGQTGENISTNEFITGHMVYNLAYTYILQTTATLVETPEFKKNPKQKS